MKPRSATKPDGEIGQRIRATRIVAGLSQAELGEKIGVSFQQVQKYEKGVNRVAVVRLQQIAGAVGVDMAALMAIPVGKPSDVSNFMSAFFATPHALDVARGFMKLTQRQRLAVCALIEGIA